MKEARGENQGGKEERKREKERGRKEKGRTERKIPSSIPLWTEE